LNKQLILLII